MQRRRKSNPNTTHWSYLYGRGSGISGDYSMGNYGQYDSGGGYLSDAERNNGDVWQTDSGKWAGKHSTGDIEYFSDKDSARNFASGKTPTQPPLSAVSDEDPYNLHGEDPYIGREDPLDLYGDEELRMDPEGPMDMGVDMVGSTDLDNIDGPECQFCGRSTSDGYCKNCRLSGFDDHEDYLDTDIDESIHKIHKVNTVWKTKNNKFGSRDLWGRVRYSDTEHEAKANLERTKQKHADSLQTRRDWGLDVSEIAVDSSLLLQNLLERNYKREYELYQGTPEQKKRRAQRNKTRRKFEREGKVRKGDGIDIHHRDGNPFNQSSKNTVPMSKSKNRSIKERAETTLESNEVLKLKELIKSLVRKKLLTVFKTMSNKSEV